MTRHYPDQGSASDWSCPVGNFIQPIRSTAQIWVVTRHQYGILRSFLRRHLVGKPVVASPEMSVFSGYSSGCKGLPASWLVWASAKIALNRPQSYRCCFPTPFPSELRPNTKL